MEENERDIFLHDWVIEEIQYQYAKEFNEIKIKRKLPMPLRIPRQAYRKSSRPSCQQE